MRRALIPVAAVAASVGIAACGGSDGDEATTSAQPGGQTQTSAGDRGRELFVETCGSCHTLSAAGTQGAIGPNLDDLRPDQARVLAAIENGGTGGGAMPAGLYEGQDAQDVAAFVAGATSGN